MTPPRPSDPGPCIALAGGGTGGHLFPGLAVADVLRARRPSLTLQFYGTGRSIERVQIPKHGYPWQRLGARPVPESVFGWPGFFWANYRAYRQARRDLRRRGVGLVVGLGGYAAAPVVRAAAALGLPVVLLEQNAIPGKANRYLSRWASLVICGLPQASGAFPSRLRVEVLGNPVRPSIVHPPTPPDPATFGLDPDKHTLLVLGGSQGAHNVNEAVVHLLADLDAYAQQWQVVHQTGSADRDDVAGAYARTSLTHHVAAFIDDMPSAYALADLMVGRAGATTLAELACTGTPAVFLPLPWAAEDHQTCNAQVYVDAGAGLIVPDRRDPALTGPDLCRAVEPLLSRAERLDPMRASALRLARPHAADLAADAILDLLPG